MKKAIAALLKAGLDQVFGRFVQVQEVDKREFAEVWGAAWAMYGKSVSPQLLSIAFEALRA
ncbi:TPA: hypothetical protein MIH04_25920 [Klebsiella pneumoniae]|nr:hypothetical protein [Klebsiella pneumoniae]